MQQISGRAVLPGPQGECESGCGCARAYVRVCVHVHVCVFVHVCVYMCVCVCVMGRDMYLWWQLQTKANTSTLLGCNCM